uniref:Transmembrane protein 18 n=2 Tax=Cynoglossus semilaevis TaxID=244447 RepID=A0A3P8WZS9_CYNSE
MTCLDSDAYYQSEFYIGNKTLASELSCSEIPVSRHQTDFIEEQQSYFRIVVFTFAFIKWVNYGAFFKKMKDAKAQNITSIPIDGFSNLRITSIWTFLQSVQWSETWLIGLLVFHVVCLCMTVVTCRYYRAQICHFLVMVGLVFSAEYLNELAAKNWRAFSNFQYFDSKGMFISLVYSIPLLPNAVVIVMVWVYRTISTMTELKTLQLKRKARREKREKSE